MTHYPYIASRLFNSPLLIHPGKLHAIVAGLSDRLGVVVPPAPQAYTTPQGIREKGGYRAFDNGVAVIDVYGILAHRGGIQADSSYIQGYDGLARQLTAAMDDPAVRAILLNIDSPGGEVAGAFQLADQIRAARSIKPIAAVAGDMAASAAYLIASAAETVSVSPTGTVGSIGVVTSHVDMSRAMDGMGVKVTYIFAGAHKVDGNPMQPLSPEVAADIQAAIDHYYELFVATVSSNRTRLDAVSVRATEARMFIGQKAVDAGLADRIETPDQAIDRLAASIIPSTGANRARGNAMGIFSFGKKRLNLDISVSEDQTPDDGAGTDDAEPQQSADPPVQEPQTLSALAIVQRCNAENMPRLAELILRTPHTAEQLDARIDNAKAVRAVCETAGVSWLADGLISAGVTESDAKGAALDALIAKSEQNPIDATPPSKKGTLPRAEFALLSPFAQREFVVSGGAVTD